ncbi:MAG: cupin domain-containing protein [Labilibaculum antarcticum]
METKKIFETEAFINNHGVEARKFYQNEHMMMIHLNLKPGDVISKHAAPLDICFLVLEGKGIVQIGDESKEVEANTLIESPANAGHGWRNESDAELRILVIKTPNPAWLKNK